MPKFNRKLRKLTVIRPDGSDTFMYIEPRLEVLQQIVGGYIQVLKFFRTYEGRPCSGAYVNEEGIRQGLKPNPKALVLWGKELEKKKVNLPTRSILGNLVIVQTMTPEDIKRYETKSAIDSIPQTFNT